MQQRLVAIGRHKGGRQYCRHVRHVDHRSQRRDKVIALNNTRAKSALLLFDWLKRFSTVNSHLQPPYGHPDVKGREDYLIVLLSVVFMAVY